MERRSTFLRGARGLRCPVLLFLIIIWVALAAQALSKNKVSETERQYREGEERARTKVIIGKVSVSIPIGRFLLIRKGSNYCAVRFTRFHREPNKPTLWSPGDDSEYAEYDWYYQRDGSGDFTKPNIESGHRELSRKPAIGLFHPLVWPRGDPFIKCGLFRLEWFYPTHVGFHMTNRKEDDVGNELAPTKWRDISEVNVHDPRLKWYRFDEKREGVDIPIDQLW